MSPGLLMLSSQATGQDMSNGADNFYTSDKVTVEKVTFKNQYRMSIAGVDSRKVAVACGSR